MKKLLVVLFLVSFEAFAWGPIGHRAVGEVAKKFLNSNATLKVNQILNGQSLAKASTWPDEIKSDPATYSYTFNWHYTDWPDEMNEHNEEHSSGTLIKSINTQLEVLKDKGSVPEKKAFALKFLTHLVGDLHMPLHVGNGLDLGGNTCKVIFQGKQTNLHALWDEGMIEFTRLSFTELANFVSQGQTVSDIRDYKMGGVVDWAHESKLLRAEIYPADVIPSEALVSSRQYCRRDTPVTVQEMPVLGYEYSYKFIPAVEKRIFQAGVRLAHLINQVF